MADPHALAREIADAVRTPPRDRCSSLGSRWRCRSPTAYAVEAELVRLRSAAGHRTVGRKVGFANKAVWRALKLDTLVWAHMYDDTVRHAKNDQADLSLGRMYSPKIEPEIVFRSARAARAGPDRRDRRYSSGSNGSRWGSRLSTACFQAGSSRRQISWRHTACTPGSSSARRCRHRRQPGRAGRAAADVHGGVVKNGEVVAEGSGKNSLRSPALCLGELASAIARQPGAEPLEAGELVSSGTLTESQFIAPGESWTATLDGLPLPALTVRTVA